MNLSEVPVNRPWVAPENVKPLVIWVIARTHGLTQTHAIYRKEKIEDLSLMQIGHRREVDLSNSRMNESCWHHQQRLLTSLARDNENPKLEFL